ncbi:MAG: cytidylate kinase-like family protein [Eubacteriales bacterium]|nr:cytidylate kinase-like family protein [Eubacteriales bacterium]
MKKRVITIGREFGSGGTTIGKKVAQELGMEFYNRDIIKNIVKETGLREKYVEHYAEFAPSADQRFAFSFVDLEDEESSPLKRMWVARNKIIRQFAEEKPCVIVGSCADYILRDREDCLNVFLYADEKTKEERIREIYGEVLLREKNRVHEMDVKRSLNYKYFTGRDWGKAQNYDLALNRGSLGIEKCVELIVRAAQ